MRVSFKEPFIDIIIVFLSNEFFSSSVQFTLNGFLEHSGYLTFDAILKQLDSPVRRYSFSLFMPLQCTET